MLDYGARMYQADLGRFGSVDPSASKYGNWTPYHYVHNNPINLIDPDGRDARIIINRDEESGDITITIQSTIFITGRGASQRRAEKLNEGASAAFTSGTFEGENGTVSINFDINYQYSDEAPEELAAGDNILNFDNDVERSEVPASASGSLGNVTTRTGNRGVIAGRDRSNNDVIYHESYHLFGLSDRYDDVGVNSNGDVTSKAHPGFENDRMGTRDKKGFSQIHYDNYGRKYAGQETGVHILTERVDISRLNGQPIGGDGLTNFQKRLIK